MSRRHSFDVITVGDLLKQITVWVVDCIVVVALALALSYLFGTRVHMEGGSMIPTLENGDRMFLNRAKGKLIPIGRFDIVAYQMPSRNGVFLKRVLALPGETVQIREGQIYINGSLLPENEYTRSLAYSGVASEPVVLGDNEYFVIGENADASLDSRFSDVGNVSLSDILGTVWLRYAPFRNIRFLP